MTAQLTQLFETHRPAVTQTIVARVRAEVPYYAHLSEAEARQRTDTILDAIGADLDSPRSEHYQAVSRQIGYTRVQQGLPMDQVHQAMRIATLTVRDALKAAYGDDVNGKIAAIERCADLSEVGLQGVAAGFEQARDELIRSQQASLHQLSSPLIPLYSGVLALPLIGTIDSHRAQEIIEALLEGVGAAQADHVIIDITGVPVVDTAVAQYLLQATKAAKLLGSQVILTGISASIAQTIVQLGVDLTDITTKANLQAGIEEALRRQGYHIRPLEVEA